MKIIVTLILNLFFLCVQAQSSIIGKLKANDGTAVLFANVALYKTSDSTLTKVETTDEKGLFKITGIPAGNYFLKATFVGLPDLVKVDIQLHANHNLDLKELIFTPQAEELKEFTISSQREMVIVKPDRTIFNIQGTVNSIGANAIELLRKAPAVTVDNNDNVNVMGRSGVIVYVDGKKLPLTGDDLSNYLKNLTADQIDRIEIITNPSAKYDAEGNAGIIDIRLKKDKNMGANGSLSSTLTHGRLTRYNINSSGNYRNKKMNLFGSVGYAVNDNFHDIIFQNNQNGLFMDEINNTQNNRDAYNYRFGSDFFLSKNQTIGFLIGGNNINGQQISFNKIAISNQQTKSLVDSVLVAKNSGSNSHLQNTYNLNYQFSNKKGYSLNVDLDYGRYENTNLLYQPNIYYNATEDSVLSEVINSFDTPININIYTGQFDYEQNLWKGKLSLGAKYSQVATDNTFKVFNIENNISNLDSVQSNQFKYTESVYAAYISYNRQITKKISFLSGLRFEQTDAKGNLKAFLSRLQESPIYLNYLNWFPSAGITWKLSKKNSLAINYSRRINRPDYNVLNPFRSQISELSIQKGNPFLKPEIVNNYELGYTLAYKYNFKLAYSRTDNQITRLIGPDERDPRAGFISWDNLATQTVISFNASLPFQITKWWSTFLNLSTSYTDNQANYGGGAIVDVQNFNYNIYQQQTFTLPKGFKGEISGYYAGPGVWGGVFIYYPNWSLNVGLQRSFLHNKLNVRLSANNIFNRRGWEGNSTFNGLTSYGTGRWDSHYGSISLSYNFGNQNVKTRKRKTGIESEEKRVDNNN